MNSIKMLREAAGMTQSALADRLGVRPPSVFKWENGMANPSLANLVAMADILGCTTDELLGRKSQNTA